MDSKELIEEGPIFLTVKPVRGEPFMKDLSEEVQKMMDNNLIRFDCLYLFKLLILLSWFFKGLEQKF